MIGVLMPAMMDDDEDDSGGGHVDGGAFYEDADVDGDVGDLGEDNLVVMALAVKASMLANSVATMLMMMSMISMSRMMLMTLSMVISIIMISRIMLITLVVILLTMVTLAMTLGSFGIISMMLVVIMLMMIMLIAMAMILVIIMLMMETSTIMLISIAMLMLMVDSHGANENFDGIARHVGNNNDVDDGVDDLSDDHNGLGDCHAGNAVVDGVGNLGDNIGAPLSSSSTPPPS